MVPSFLLTATPLGAAKFANDTCGQPLEKYCLDIHVYKRYT